MKCYFPLFLMSIFAGASWTSSLSADDACTTNQWVRLTDDNRLLGDVVVPMESNQVEGLTRATVSLVGINGKVKTGTTSSKGRFTFRDVEPGVYALAASTDERFALMAIHVIDPSRSGAAGYPERVTLPVAELSMPVAMQAMGRYTSSTSGYSDNGSEMLSKINYAAIAKLVCVENANRVLQSDGGLSGRVFLPGVVDNALQPAAQTNVFIFQNGDEVGRDVTNAAGEFNFAELEPGTYGFMAAGPSGFSTTGFELVSENPASDSDANVSQVVEGRMSLVMQNQGLSSSFGTQLSDPSSALAATESLSGPQDDTDGDEAAPTQTSDSPFAGLSVPPGTYIDGGGFSGGASGGGGFGGGGGGGLGGIAALAGIGGIIAATSDDDDGANFVTPQPVSGATPAP